MASEEILKEQHQVLYPNGPAHVPNGTTMERQKSERLRAKNTPSTEATRPYHVAKRFFNTKAEYEECAEFIHPLLKMRFGDGHLNIMFDEVRGAIPNAVRSVDYHWLQTCVSLTLAGFILTVTS